MASKEQTLAAKQRQQKIILAVGGVLLAGLLAIQGPKLMKQLKGSKSSSSAAAATTTPASTTPDSSGTATTPAAGTTTPTTGVTAPAVATKGGQTAEVAGVVIRYGGLPSASTGQLLSLSRFKAKDPFVQKVSQGSGSGTGASGGSTAPGATTGSTAGKGGAIVGSVATPTTATPALLGYATLMVNGKAQQLQLKQLFPKSQPTFVLVGVNKKFVKVTVAGGKFTGGKAIVLELGKTVTLMNTATGQRFVMKLVFTGAQPEQIAGFKAPATGTTTTPTTPATATPSATTTASNP